MRRLLLLLFLLLPLPFSAFAQSPKPLSLADAEALYLQHNRELALARAAAGSAEADVRTAGQRPNPQASLNLLSISPWSGYGAGGWKDKKMDTQLRLDQVVERGGKRELRLREAEARRDAAHQDIDEAGRQQLLALRWAYYDLLLAQDRERLVREAAELYGRTIAAGQLRQKAGDISPIDLSRLQIEQARAENDTRQARAELEQAQIALAYLIGREAQASTLKAEDNWPGLETRETLPAHRPRPDIEAARLRLAAAEAARDQAKAKKIRDLTVSVQLEHNLQNAPTNSYGFGVSMPLFIWHEYEGEIARAEAELDAARLQYNRTLAQATGDTHQAGTLLRSAQDRRRRLETGLLADAEKVARAAEFAFGKGAMSLMDLLDARRTLRQVQLEASAARAEHAKALAAWQLQGAFLAALPDSNKEAP